ncbi:MAG: GNAT family N-acetyltransferase [Planctomycetota bacterium]|jgi:N-acetylglutamate synthase-like GNAT family acetyltransferase
MLIRQANETDNSILLDILRKSFAGVAERFNLTPENCPKNLAFCTKQRIKDDFARGLKYYILEKDGQPCGCIAIEKASRDVCYLQRLAVLPPHRRKGYGKALVNHIFDQAGKYGAQKIEIGIIAEDKKLTNWYGKFGFVLKGTKKFDHLPFIVAFMSAEIDGTNQTEKL